MTGTALEANDRDKGDSWQDHNKRTKTPESIPKTSPSKETTGERDNDLKPMNCKQLKESPLGAQSLVARNELL